MSYPNTGRRRTQRPQPLTQRLTRPARDDGCCCDHGPTIVATWRDSNLTVAIEHWAYCPVPSIPLDPDVYATTGRRLPLETGAAQ